MEYCLELVESKGSEGSVEWLITITNGTDKKQDFTENKERVLCE